MPPKSGASMSGSAPLSQLRSHANAGNANGVPSAETSSEIFASQARRGPNGFLSSRSSPLPEGSESSGQSSGSPGRRPCRPSRPANVKPEEPPHEIARRESRIRSAASRSATGMPSPRSGRLGLNPVGGSASVGSVIVCGPADSVSPLTRTTGRSGCPGFQSRRASAFCSPTEMPCTGLSANGPVSVRRPCWPASSATVAAPLAGRSTASSSASQVAATGALAADARSPIRSGAGLAPAAPAFQAASSSLSGATAAISIRHGSSCVPVPDTAPVTPSTPPSAPSMCFQPRAGSVSTARCRRASSRVGAVIRATGSASGELASVVGASSPASAARWRPGPLVPSAALIASRAAPAAAACALSMFEKSTTG